MHAVCLPANTAAVSSSTFLKLNGQVINDVLVGIFALNPEQKGINIV